MLASLLIHTALAATLAFDPLHEPEIVGAAPEVGPGAVRIRFPNSSLEIPVLPAAVLALRAGVPVPADLQREGIPLGRSRRSWSVPARPGESGVDVARRWASRPEVESVVPDLVLRHKPAFDDPEYESQWYLERIAMDPLYAVSLGSADVRVAVIDSGFELDHPDLEAGFVDGYDAHDDDDDPSVVPDEYCPEGTLEGTLCDEHGTAVSGIIGARANNGIGIVGMCPECTLVPIKMLGEDGSTSADVRAFEHAIDTNAGVINNSWGFVEPTEVPAPLASVIERAATEPRDGLGAVVVFAAGNDDREIGSDELEALSSVLCVSATTSYGIPTAYTNYGPTVDISAPSATFTTTVYGGYTEDFGGTSAAAPIISGMAGWILSVSPELSAEEVSALLMETAVMPANVTDVEDGHSDFYGWGQISPPALLAALFPDSEDTDAETPRACGCSAADPAFPGWVGAATVLVLSRRSLRRHG